MVVFCVKIGAVFEKGTKQDGHFGPLDMSARAGGHLLGRIEADAGASGCCNSSFDVTADMELDADIGIEKAFDFQMVIGSKFSWTKGMTHTTPHASLFSNVKFCLQGVFKAIKLKFYELTLGGVKLIDI